MAISLKIPQPSVTTIGLKITFLKFQSNLPEFMGIMQAISHIWKRQTLKQTVKRTYLPKLKILASKNLWECSHQNSACKLSISFIKIYKKSNNYTWRLPVRCAWQTQLCHHCTVWRTDPWGASGLRYALSSVTINNEKIRLHLWKKLRA